MGFWGPSKKESWLQFCNEMEAEYIDRGFWKGDKVEFYFENITIVLDTYTVSTGKSSATFTRIRAPFVNESGFNFRVYNASIFSGMAKALGAQDIEIGDDAFDKEFMIKGNNELAVKTLISNPRIKELFMSLPKVDLRVNDDEGIFGADFPEGTDELYFVLPGIVKDVANLKNIFCLFGEILIELTDLGIAGITDPNVVL
jgi:hypothetical protein